MAIREYEDFYIRISAESRRGEGYPVFVQHSPAGNSSQDIKMKLRVDNSPLLEELEAFRQGACDTRRLKRIGEALFLALFQESEDAVTRSRGQIAQLFFASLGRMTIPGADAASERGLRIRLHIDAPDLHNVPWELLVTSPHAQFLAAASATPVVRHFALNPGAIHTALRTPPPLRVLLMLIDQQNPDSLSATETY